MQKNLVRVANAVLDLEQFETGKRKVINGNLASETSRPEHGKSMDNRSPQMESAVKNLLDNGLPNRRPDPYASGLKAAIAEYTGLPAEYIGCYPGDYMSLDYLSRTFLESGTDMLVSGPVSCEKLIPATSVGASIVEIHHEDPFSPDLEAIIDRIGKRSRILYLGNPAETVGSFLTEAELIFLAAYAENTMVVVDESYFEFSGLTVSELTAKFANLAVIRSFSHAFGLTGLNVGYIITDPENLSRIDSLTGTHTVDFIAQAVAQTALNSRAYMENNVSAVNKSKELISGSLPGFGYEFFVSPANFVVLRVSDTESACKYLNENDFHVTDLDGVRQLEDFVRITIGSPDETDRLLLLLCRIADEIATGYNRNRIDNISTESEIDAHAGTRAK